MALSKSPGYVPTSPAAAKTDKKKPCKCKNSKCLKLYCECFRIGAYCDNCNCKNCFNNPENEKLRKHAIELTLERNPRAFRPKIATSPLKLSEDVHRAFLSRRGPPPAQWAGIRHVHDKGCHCKKTQCLKKYCECFQAGIYCSENCKCQECKNYDGSVERAQLEAHGHCAPPKKGANGQPQSPSSPSEGAENNNPVPNAIPIRQTRNDSYPSSPFSSVPFHSIHGQQSATRSPFSGLIDNNAIQKLCSRLLSLAQEEENKEKQKAAQDLLWLASPQKKRKSSKSSSSPRPPSPSTPTQPKIMPSLSTALPSSTLASNTSLPALVSSLENSVNEVNQAESSEAVVEKGEGVGEEEDIDPANAELMLALASPVRGGLRVSSRLQKKQQQRLKNRPYPPPIPPSPTLRSSSSKPPNPRTPVLKGKRSQPPPLTPPLIPRVTNSTIINSSSNMSLSTQVEIDDAALMCDEELGSEDLEPTLQNKTISESLLYRDQERVVLNHVADFLRNFLFRAQRQPWEPTEGADQRREGAEDDFSAFSTRSEIPLGEQTPTKSTKGPYPQESPTAEFWQNTQEKIPNKPWEPTEGVDQKIEDEFPAFSTHSEIPLGEQTPTKPTKGPTPQESPTAGFWQNTPEKTPNRIKNRADDYSPLFKSLIPSSTFSSFPASTISAPTKISRMFYWRCLDQIEELSRSLTSATDEFQENINPILLSNSTSYALKIFTLSNEVDEIWRTALPLRSGAANVLLVKLEEIRFLNCWGCKRCRICFTILYAVQFYLSCGCQTASLIFGYFQEQPPDSSIHPLQETTRGELQTILTHHKSNALTSESETLIRTDPLEILSEQEYGTATPILPET